MKGRESQKVVGSGGILVDEGPVLLHRIRQNTIYRHVSESAVLQHSLLYVCLNTMWQDVVGRPMFLFHHAGHSASTRRVV
jgi:hypothetical protein